MKFILASNPTFKQAVTVLPSAGEQGVIEFEFKYIKPKDLTVWLDGTEGRRMVDVLAEIIISWSNVYNEAGEAIPYSREALEMLLGELYIADIIFNGFVSGLRGARAKN